MEDQDSIEIRSEAFREVLGEPPSWLLRWGITAVLGCFIALILFGYFFKYPETVSAPIRLETENPPIEIATTTIGRITPLIAEETKVLEGTILAHLKDPYGDFASILALDSILNDFKISKKVPDFKEIEKWKLGPVQTSFYQYVQSYQGNGFSTIGYGDQAINTYDKNIASKKGQIENLKKQIAQKRKRLKDIPVTREKLKKAYSEDVSNEKHIDLYGLLETENRLKEDIQIWEGQIIETEKEIREQELHKSNIQRGIIDKSATKQQAIKISLNNLESKIEEWKKSHLIEASSDGTLYYQDKIKAKEFSVTEGQPVFAIVPPNAEDKIEGKLYLSSEESVKVKEGQRVKIKFSAFRPSEYGLLNGTVVDKATIPRNGQYLVRVQLDNDMISTKGKTITFEHQMQGNAQIITKDRRFLQLIFDQFAAMLSRREG